MRSTPTTPDAAVRNGSRPAPKDEPASAPAAPHVIHPRAIYSLVSARLALGLAKATLPREIRLGRLRVSKRGGRYYLTGQWLLDWIRSGELGRKSQQDESGPQS